MIVVICLLRLDVHGHREPRGRWASARNQTAVRMPSPRHRRGPWHRGAGRRLPAGWPRCATAAVERSQKVTLVLSGSEDGKRL